MSRKKQKYQKRTFESTGTPNDVFAGLYISMLTHPAWCRLTPKQQQLYLYCKLQYYGQGGRRAVDSADNTKFYFNRALWQDVYKLYKKGSESGFYRDMNVLIDHGFIRCLESGKTTRTKSIYQFSSMWQKWETEAFVVLPNEMTSSLLKRYREGQKETP